MVYFVEKEGPIEQPTYDEEGHQPGRILGVVTDWTGRFGELEYVGHLVTPEYALGCA